MNVVKYNITRKEFQRAGWAIIRYMRSQNYNSLKKFMQTYLRIAHDKNTDFVCFKVKNFRLR